MLLSKSQQRVAALLLAALGAGWYVTRKQGVAPPEKEMESTSREPAEKDAAQLAFENRSQGRVIAVKGKVERILTDDRDGSPHQRFIIRTQGGVSLLIAHNLELAPRLEGLAPGDAIAVLGEYEWSEKGGVMHWTHDDPQGRHEAGYIEWRGRRYQ